MILPESVVRFLSFFVFDRDDDDDDDDDALVPQSLANLHPVKSLPFQVLHSNSLPCCVGREAQEGGIASEP
jgi:hypothetical protein